MTVEAILSAARDGLTYERMRMDAASRNIAAANVPVAPGASATHLQAEATASPFGQLLDAAPAIAEQDATTREVHDPGHPLADENGMVRYPDTDMVFEMTSLMTASRGYEANVRSFNLLRGMVMRALEIGAK